MAMTRANARILPATMTTVPTALFILQDEKCTYTAVKGAPWVQKTTHRKLKCCAKTSTIPTLLFPDMYQGEERAWVVEKTVTFTEQKKTIDEDN